MKISSVMSRDVQLIKPDDTIRSAAALMKKIDAGLLPVTENDKLVGMITDRDIAIRGVAEGKGPDAKVREAMSPEVKYCFEDEDVAHVAENMAELQASGSHEPRQASRRHRLARGTCDRRFTAENSKGASRHFATGRPT